ncbi:MAG: type II secretion system F family protein [Clostridiales bacterium]|nr:type II secretion system F family protein [Clostridiales bacterium]
MNEFAFIYIFFISFALCIATLFIIRIREQKHVLTSEDEDFFTRFCDKKKHMLKVNLPAVSLRMYLAAAAASPVVFGIVFWLLFPNKFFAAVMAAFTVLLPDFIIRILVDTRKKKYEERYVRALKTFASALRSGMSIQQAVQDVIRNPFIAEDIRSGFRQIDSDIRVGISVENAFGAFAERADNNDARDVSAAISMQAQVGGSEARVIDTLAMNIEDRLLTKKRIRAIFASTDFMVNAFDILPFIALIIMYVGMPDYISPILYNPAAFILCIVVLLSSLYGSLSIRKRLHRAKGE